MLAVSLPASMANTSTTCEAENKVLLERLERLERIFNASHMNLNLDEASLLELFALQVRTKLFASVPATDDECNFNWVVGKCYPLCQCKFAPKFGDLSPSRACRLVPPLRRDPACDPASAQTPWFVRLMQGVSSILRASHGAALMVGRAITDNAPPTDAQCRFSWKKIGCVPKIECTLVYEMGDYSLDRMCRLRVDDFDDETETEERNELGEKEDEVGGARGGNGRGGRQGRDIVKVGKEDSAGGVDTPRAQAGVTRPAGHAVGVGRALGTATVGAEEGEATAAAAAEKDPVLGEEIAATKEASGTTDPQSMPDRSTNPRLDATEEKNVEEEDGSSSNENTHAEGGANSAGAEANIDTEKPRTSNANRHRGPINLNLPIQ